MLIKTPRGQSSDLPFVNDARRPQTRAAAVRENLDFKCSAVVVVVVVKLPCLTLPCLHPPFEGGKFPPLKGEFTFYAFPRASEIRHRLDCISSMPMFLSV